MTSIDTTISTQIGDAARPPQTSQDSQLQTQAAQTQQTNATADANTSQEVSSKDANANLAQLKQVVETFSYKQLSIKMDLTDNAYYLQVTDSETGDVIQQIPTKNMRDLQVRLQQSNPGALLNQQA